MSLYFSYTPNISTRRANNIFIPKSNLFFLKQGKKDLKEIFAFQKLQIDSYQKIVIYAETNRIDSFEIVLLDNNLLEELLSFLSQYLLDKDVSIGIITTDEELIEKENKMLNSFGVTLSRPGIHHLVDDVFSPSFCIAKADIAGEKEDEDFCVNGLPNQSLRISKRKPTRTKEKARVKLSKASPIQLEESFHEKFIKLLIESGKENVEIYKKAGITRQVFSRILSDKDMIPTKLTLVSLCIGLELPLVTAKELMVSAGYSLSRSLMFDSIVIKYLREEIYDFELINSELDEYGCQLLGWHPRDN